MLTDRQARLKEVLGMIQHCSTLDEATLLLKLAGCSAEFGAAWDWHGWWVFYLDRDGVRVDGGEASLRSLTWGEIAGFLREIG